MRLSSGDRLDHFEILSAIGKGGMGEVYKARDTRLNRVVAIKVSEASFSERFEREARAIAALNHPNVCTLHDVGPNYLVMEYVEGESPKGPLSLDQGLRIATQVAAALEAAHGRGLVHRDLKPGNILVKPDGTVKVLDFGLAKMMQAPAFDPDEPTAQAPLTEAGMVMGTPAYMAPEQAEGKPIDKRADIWAFGVILFELFSGERLFKADSAQNTLAQVLSKDPDFSRVPKETHLLLRRCLERDPSRRLRDIGDAMPLVALTTGSEAGSGPSASPDYRPWIAAAVFALVALALGVARFREAPAPAPASVRFRVPYPDGLKPSEGAGFSLSPDGNTIAFATGGVDGSRLWVQDLDSLEPRLLLGPEIGAGLTFWSFDSKSVLFYAQGRLKRADLTGGGAQTLGDSPGLIIGGSSSRDQILFGALGAAGIMNLPAAGGTPEAVTKVDASRKERAHIMPFFLPDGRHFLYLRNSSAAENAGIYVGSLDNLPGEQPERRLIPASTGASFVPGSEGRGSILFLRDGLLMAQDFDTLKLQVQGEPWVLARGVGSTRAFPFFAASTSGNLVYRTAPTLTRQMTWFDRRGRELEEVGEPFPLSDAPRLNPSGTHFVISQWDAADRSNDLWLYTLSPYSGLRLTRGPATNEGAIWSFDGSRVAYASARSEHIDLYAVNANGDGQQAPLLQSPDEKHPLSWSRDGYLLYGVRGPGASVDLRVLGPDGKSFPFLDSSANELAGSFSPDGKWIAYLSDESGTPEMYLRAFKAEAAKDGVVAGPRIPLPTGGASSPRWRADGREILYIAADGNLMALPITPGDTAQIGRPVALFKAPTTFIWDATPDGQRFLFAIPVGQQTVAPFTVVLNWRAADRGSASGTP